jgi:hypothetical protein
MASCDPFLAPVTGYCVDMLVCTQQLRISIVCTSSRLSSPCAGDALTALDLPLWKVPTKALSVSLSHTLGGRVGFGVYLTSHHGTGLVPPSFHPSRGVSPSLTERQVRHKAHSPTMCVLCECVCWGGGRGGLLLVWGCVRWISYVFIVLGRSFGVVPIRHAFTKWGFAVRKLPVV